MTEIPTFSGYMGGSYYMDYSYNPQEYKRIKIYKFDKEFSHSGKNVVYAKTMRYECNRVGEAYRRLIYMRFKLTREEALLIMSEQI